MDPAILIVLIYLPTWWYLNRLYSRIYGHRLKTRYAWASMGALIMRKRFPEWERPQFDGVVGEWRCAGCMAETAEDLQGPCPGTYTGDHVTL